MTIEQARTEIEAARADVGFIADGAAAALARLTAAEAALPADSAPVDPVPVPDEPVDEPDPPAPEPAAGRWIDWVDPPSVPVPQLVPGEKPRVHVPGTNVDVVFTQPIKERWTASCQMTYEHATAAGVGTDPLVSPGNGAHSHDYWGSKLPDVEDLERLYALAPRFDAKSVMATKGGAKTWAVDVAHQPGVWHPTVIVDGKVARRGSGSALNYVRSDTVGGVEVHSRDDRLMMLPNGVGWVSFKTRVNYVGGKWRISWDGPTWAFETMRVGSWDTPDQHAENFAFGHQPNPWGGQGVPLAHVQKYFKSPDLGTDPAVRPEPEYAMAGSGVEGHIDYVAGSTPLKVEGGKITGPADPNWTGETILFGQWMLDLTVNAHLFGAPMPLYGRWELRAAS